MDLAGTNCGLVSRKQGIIKVTNRGHLTDTVFIVPQGQQRHELASYKHNLLTATENSSSVEQKRRQEISYEITIHTSF